MKTSTASIIIAFFSMLAVQASPAAGGIDSIAARSAGELIEARDAPLHELTSRDNEIGDIVERQTAEEEDVEDDSDYSDVAERGCTAGFNHNSKRQCAPGKNPCANRNSKRAACGGKLAKSKKLKAAN